MSGLREELERIAATAPTAEVPADLWHRARRSRLRDRALVVAAGVAVVALVAGLVAWAPQQAETPAVGEPPGEPAVPDRLAAVPGHVVELDGTGEFRSGLVSRGLDVGRAAAAWPESYSITLVGADDGAYHLAEVPAYFGGPVALSPDGRALAVATVEDELLLADLTTGETSTVPTETAGDPRIRDIVWSYDGGWLAWQSASGSVGRSQIEGPEVARTDPPVDLGGPGALTIAGDGEALVVQDGTIASWRPRGRIVTGPGDPSAGPAAISPDGSTLALGGSAPAALIARGGPLMVVERDYGALLDTATVDTVDPGRAIPLGWLDDETSVWRVEAADDGPGYLALVDPAGRVTRVAEVDAAVRGLSVATGLMTRPTVSRPAPDWPWSPTARVTAIGSVVGVLVLMLAAMASVRTKRETGSAMPRLRAYERFLLSATIAGLVTAAWFLFGASVVGSSDLRAQLLVPAVVMLVAFVGLGVSERKAVWFGVVVGPPIAIGVLLTLYLTQTS